jgi:hypothetical protein
MTRYDSQLTSVVLLELQLRVALVGLSSAVVSWCLGFLRPFENALLERQKMVNPRSRGKHPKLTFAFNYTPLPAWESAGN